jgi:aconitate hydratase
MNSAAPVQKVPGHPVSVIDIRGFCGNEGVRIDRLPYALRILVENALRRGDIESARQAARRETGKPLTFLPSRVLLQDMLGIPVLVDLASMRDAARAKGKDPAQVNPVVPVDLVVDHSLIPVHFGTADARARNEAREIDINRERYRFLRWCQTSFANLRVVPPGKGIMHQINVEFLASGYTADAATGLAFPDTVYGTDSHTPMVNGIGVLGWGVGGLEAEMAILGRDTSFPVPEVVGIRLSGRRPAGTTATDLVLTITERLRRLGVVGKFVEFTGDSLDDLPVADRCTIANMAPEFGATCVYFPIDRQTIRYLDLLGKEPGDVTRVEACARTQGLWREGDAPDYDILIDLDLAEIVPSVAGPRRPQDRVPLSRAPDSLAGAFPLDPARRVRVAGEDYTMGDGDIVIAAITSCTNTSNPSVVVAAALLARNAARLGLKPKPWVKTSFAPGSQAVAAYLAEAGLQEHLDTLGFNIVGFACTTCNGGSGPLPEPVSATIREHDLTCVAALSGNRNFEGRIHPDCRANYIMSPPLVVAHALAGSMTIDLAQDPIGTAADGSEVRLADIWPGDEEIAEVIARHVHTGHFRDTYSTILDGGAGWNGIERPDGGTFEWEPDSAYLRSAPYFDTPPGDTGLTGLRPLVMLGDSITTDHISPSGEILAASAAGAYLQERGLTPERFNTYGTRRGNHEVAMRSAFANIRLRNEIVDGEEGSLTMLMPEGERMSVFDAAMAYRARGTGLVVIAGREYGCGSSRDTAAKCIHLLGVRAVIAESFERIHRTNLVCMGILPLQFRDGESRRTLGLTGDETFDIHLPAEGLAARCEVELVVNRADGSKAQATLLARIDTPVEVDYLRDGGVLSHVLANLPAATTAA